MTRKLRCIALVLTVVATWSGVARATDDSAKGAARELATEAKRDFDAGHFEEAGQKFQRAYEVAKVPALAVWTARALVKYGQLVAASELYRQAKHLTPNDLWIGNVQQLAQADAEKELAELQPRIPRLRVRVEGAEANDVEFTIDDVNIANALFGVEIPKDPGRRHVVGKRGEQTVEQTIELGEGEHKEAVLTFISPVQLAIREPPPPPRPPPPPLPPDRSYRTLAWVAGGLGVVSLSAGGVFTALCHNNFSTTESQYNPSAESAGKTYAALQWVGYGLGAASVAAAVVLFKFNPKATGPVALTPTLGQGFAGASVAATY